VGEREQEQRHKEGGEEATHHCEQRPGGAEPWRPGKQRGTRETCGGGGTIQNERVRH
jgi:hypothetical protein